MFTIVVPWLINQVLKEFMTETDKKEEIKNILELGSSNTENYNNNDLYSYLKRIT